MEPDTLAPGERLPRRPRGPLATAEAFLAHPGAVDDMRLRLFLTAGLAAAGVAFFRGAALPALAGALLGAVAVLALLYFGFHNLGLRVFGRLWPGVGRAVATALLLFCLCPPNTPVWVAFGLALLAVAIEGRLRQVSLPVAVSGVLLVWPLAWAWQVHAGHGFVRPFDLRPLDEPIRLWSQSQIAVDPVRLYTGNVPGLLGVTSFGLVALAFLVLAYARRGSWAYLAGAALPVLALLVATRQPLSVYLISGPALAFTGLVGADNRRLPRSPAWRAGAGFAAGVLAALLIRSGVSYPAFACGVLVSSIVVSLFQIYGLAGAPAVVPTVPAGSTEPAWGPALTMQALALVVFLPLGLILLWRDASLSRSARTSLATLGVGLYAVAAAVAVAWVNYFRLPG